MAVVVTDENEANFAASAGSCISLFDSRTSETVGQFRPPSTRDITGLDFSHTSQRLAASDEGGTVTIFDIRKSGSEPLFECTSDYLTQPASSVAISKSGNFVVAGFRERIKNYMDCVMMGYDLTGSSPHPPDIVLGGNPAITSTKPFSYSHQSGFPSSFVSSVCFNSDGCALATASHDGNISVFRRQV